MRARDVVNFFNCLVRFFSAALICAGFDYYAAAQDVAKNLSIEKGEQAIKIFDAGRHALSYKFAGVPKKPYIAELFTPAGVQVLRDSPPDHKHHHGVMFALSVDGVNFWEEHTPQSGLEVHRTFSKISNNIGDESRAGFVEELDWLAPDSDKPLLQERREIHLLKMKETAQPVTLILWRSRLSVPQEKNTAKLEGRIYFGLGARFPASMDRNGLYFHAPDGSSKEIEKGDSRLITAKWCAYSALADGKPVTLAIFDHPTNLRHPATFFMKTKGFAYLSATLNLAEKPFVLDFAKPLTLTYAVAVWDGKVDAAIIEALYKQWLTQAADF